jgi:hypothetical protein
MKMAEAFSYSSDFINKVSWSSLRAKAPRPADMSLSDIKLRNFIGHDLGTSIENIYALKALMKTSLFNKVKNL